MSELESKINLEYHGKKYTVATINSNRTKVPLLLDRPTYKILKNMNKKWYINDKNHVYCMHSKKRTNYQVYMHDIVMKLNEGELQDTPIIHINNIHFDNRIDNLQYDDLEKDYSKNTRKKRRTIDLSEHGIDSKALPTYLWYLKPDASHGSRFMIDIQDEISWKSTSSKKVSLRYKLEEAKKYLRFLRESRNDLFCDYCMNGDLNKRGLELYNQYRKMINSAGFDMPEFRAQTDGFLKEDTTGLSVSEIYLLYTFDPKQDSVDVRNTLDEFDQILEKNL